MATLYEMPRYDLTVLGQDPSSGIMTEQTTGHLDFYKEGATVRAGNSIANGASGAILVYDTGAIAVGDFIFVNLVTTQSIEVTGISYGSISVTNNSGSPFVVSQWDRVVSLTNRPLMYADERARSAGFNQLGLAAGGVAAYGFNFDALLYDGAGVVQRLIKEATPIGGEDEVDVRKFGALCDGVTDDTDALLAAIDYVEAHASLYGPRVLRLHGAPQVSGKLTIAQTGVIIRGDGQTATYLQMMAAVNLLEISGPNVVIVDLSLQFSPAGGIANRPLDILSTAANFRGRRLRVVTPGTGIAVRSDGAAFNDVLVEAGDGWSRMFTIVGQATQNIGTSIVGLRAVMEGNGSQFGIVVESDAKHFRLSQSVLTTSDPATQAFTVLQFQRGGGNAPQDIVVTDSFLSAGEANIAVNVHAGYGIRFNNVLVTDSRIGFRTATVATFEAEEVSWNGCGCIGIGEAAWVFDDGDTVKRMIGCYSSDVSQDASGVHPHVSINADNVFIDGFTFGNHIRETAPVAAAGVKYESTTVHAGGHVHGVVNVVSPGGISGLAGGGVAIVAPDAFVDQGIDISHNAEVKNLAFDAGPTTPDHTGMSVSSRSTGALVGDTHLQLTDIGVMRLTGAARTFVSATVRGNDGQIVRLVNISAATFAIPHIGGTLLNKGAVPKVILPNEYISYLMAGGVLRQMHDAETIG